MAILERQRLTRTSETVASLARRDAMRAVAPADSMSAKILGMQQNLGNQAVQQRASLCPAFPSACPTGGACHTCPARIQAKLAVNQPGDMYEQEADHVAEAVMRRPGPQAPAGGADTGGVQPSTVPPIVHEVLRSPGQSLDPATRAFFEPRLRHDFSQVRVHTDARAAEATRAVNALAYTVGHSIAFATNQYVPDTPTGARLLAHELAHTIQSRSTGTEHDLVISSPTSTAEEQADSAAQAVISDQAATVVSGGVGNTLFRYGVAEALREATTLETRYPGWRFVLPNCPCTDAEARGDTATWTGPNECMPRYHPGAVTGYRTKRGYPSSVSDTSHGQQCCYDGDGKLITQGAGAGTPDVWAPIWPNTIKRSTAKLAT